MLRIAFAIIVGLGATVFPAFGQEKLANKKPSIALPTFERIASAKSLLDRKVLRGNKELGTVADLAIDLETEHVALLLIALPGADAQAKQEFLAVPTAVFDFDEKRAVLKPEVSEAMLAAARRFATKATRINRKWAAEEYASFRRDVYWADFRDRVKKEQPNRKFDEERPELTLYSQIRDIAVADEKDRSIGKIVDLAVDGKQNVVAYVAYDANDSDAGLRAIPLGAFEASEGAKQWQIMLPEESVNRFAAFPAGSDWPKQIERGWVEYIAVRYGRGGLQSPQNRK